MLTPSAEYLLYPGHLPSRLSDGGYEALVEALRRLNTEGQIRLDSLDEVAARQTSLARRRWADERVSL
ncbi:MAG: hypothetical protein Q8L05_10440 [Actinomycetota bacterium]|nr:hypothetical protein [Actinomycetota bacterium]MDP2288064.1 hypothetical protein [Actinomycetota bacterium]